MPTYYFIIQARHGGYDDPSGTNLPDVEAARAYANQIIEELKESGHDPQYLTLDVKDEARKTILSISFRKG